MRTLLIFGTAAAVFYALTRGLRRRQAVLTTRMVNGRPVYVAQVPGYVGLT